MTDRCQRGNLGMFSAPQGLVVHSPELTMKDEREELRATFSLCTGFVGRSPTLLRVEYSSPAKTQYHNLQESRAQKVEGGAGSTRTIRTTPGSLSCLENC